MYDLACIFSMSGRLYSDIPNQGYFSCEYTFKTCPHSCGGSILANFKCVSIYTSLCLPEPILGLFLFNVVRVKNKNRAVMYMPDACCCGSVASVLYCRALQVFNTKGSPLKLPNFFRCKDLIKPLQSRNRY